MKKMLLYTCFVMMAMPLFAQQKTYLHTDAAGNTWQAVYIDTNRQNPVYDKISDFPTQANICIQFAPGKTPKAKDLPLLSDKWCRLYQYKGKYYVYAPANWQNNYRMKIIYNYMMVRYTDTTMRTESVIKYKKKNKATTAIAVQDYYGNRNMATCGFTRIMDTLPKIFCTVIEARQKIVIWQGLEKPGEQVLMVAAENVRNFPVIIMNDEPDKTKEFVFDALVQKPILK